MTYFIRKNTSNILITLEEKLGYTPNIFGVSPEDDSVVVDPSSREFYTWDIFPDQKPYEGIDCGTNEELFLALSALREDTDFYQWFIKDGVYVKCYTDNWSNQGYHKATPEELIEYFRDGNTNN